MDEDRDRSVKSKCTMIKDHEDSLENGGQLDLVSTSTSSGYAHLEENAPKLIPTQEKSASLSEMFSLADSFDILLMVIGSIAATAAGFSFPVVNILFGQLVDALNASGSNFADRIETLALYLVYIAIVNMVSSTIQVGCWSCAGERQAQKWREKYVRSILSQEIGWFDVVGASELSTKVSEYFGKIQDGTTRKASELILYSAQFVGSYIVGFYLNWKLTLVLLAAFPLIAASGGYLVQAITSAQQKSSENYAKAGGVANESLTAIRTVSSLNSQIDVLEKYRVYLLEAMQIGIKKGLSVGIGQGSVFGCMLLSYALGFWYGGVLVADSMAAGCSGLDLSSKCVTGGNVIATFFSVIIGSFSVGQAAPSVTAFFSAKAAIVPVLEVVNREPLIDGLSEEGFKPKERLKGNIEVSDVYFSYPSRPSILVCKGYSLSIRAGETVALVGTSGSGKSTLVNLLLRFYDVQGGSISFDGVNIKDLNCRCLRSNIGFVGQEPVLFFGSIFENIAYGLNSISTDGEYSREQLMEHVVAAAKLANAHEFIMNCPQGYDTDVGSNGAAMSGGQKQRIAIARALIKKPAVLLLDEATSALDNTSERMVQESIDKLQQSKAQTTIVIAHRLSTVRNADKIAVVLEGRIAELGTHDELLKNKSGLYTDLVRLQMDTTEESRSTTDCGGLLSRVAETENEVDLIANKVVPDADIESAIVSTEKGVEEDTKENKTEMDKKVSSLVWKHPRWLLITIVGGLGFGAIFPIWGLVLAKTFTMFFQPTPHLIRVKATEIAIYFIIIAIGAMIFATSLFYGAAQVSERVSMRLRDQLFEAILRRNMAYFDKNENNIGALTVRLSDDSRIVSKAAGEAIAKQIQAVCTLLVGLGLGFSACWELSLIVFATFPINIIGGAISHQAEMGQASVSVSDGGEGAVIFTAFNNMRTVTAFSMQFKITNVYSAITQAAAKKRVWKSFFMGAAFGISNMCMFCTYALIMWYGGRLIRNGTTTFELLMQAMFCLMFGVMGAGTALADMGDQTDGLKAARRIFDIVEDSAKSSIDGMSTSGLIPATRAAGNIELKNVTFRYPARPEVTVCQNYNLQIKSGEVVALVGPSGSGKSTIINLLLRYYDPEEGEILLDGTNIKELNVRWLRTQISLVGQEPVLFSGSVASNIEKGRAKPTDYRITPLDDLLVQSDAKGFTRLTSRPQGNQTIAASVAPAVADDDVVEAAKIAYAHDFILNFPQGYNTDVGEGSIMISGGQKQRIAIARAVVRRPAVLLLDEATSALDSNSERMVQQAIDELQRSKTQTTIIIAHRLSTIKTADKILVIDKGSIVQTGSHDELVRDTHGLYYTLWNKQQG